MSKQRSPVSRNVYPSKHSGGRDGKSVMKVNGHIPFNPASPLLGIFPKKVIRFVQRCMCIFAYTDKKKQT